MKARNLSQGQYYRGVPMVGFDLIKEIVLVTIGIGAIVLALSIGLSSPDSPSVTIKGWANADPADFVTTAAAELAGTSDTATYGPPYTDGNADAAGIGPFVPQTWAGNALHVDTAQEFVLGPLTTVSTGDTALQTALTAFSVATPDQQQAWLTAYTDALANATYDNNTIAVAAGDYGPVTVLMQKELTVAQGGSLDGMLLAGSGTFFQTNYSAPLLFMGDGGYLESLAAPLHLTGDKWGVMNETGNYPGQTWLWLFSMPYQLPPYNTADNADLLVVMTVGVLTLLLALVPFIPILRDIPRWIPLHRLIWRHSGSPESEGSETA